MNWILTQKADSNLIIHLEGKQSHHLPEYGFNQAITNIIEVWCSWRNKLAGTNNYWWKGKEFVSVWGVYSLRQCVYSIAMFSRSRMDRLGLLRFLVHNRCKLANYFLLSLGIAFLSCLAQDGNWLDICMNFMWSSFTLSPWLNKRYRNFTVPSFKRGNQSFWLEFSGLCKHICCITQV